MKKSVYDKLEDIPQADRDENNYQLCTDAGSVNNGKWVLLLDGAHPVQMKNTELLGEKAKKETEHQTAVSQKDAEISRLNGELKTAKESSGLPAGQVAVTTEDHQLLGQVKQLGEFKDIKAKVDEYAVLKEKDEANTRKTLLTEAATAHGINPDAFVSLAEIHKLAEKLDKREIDDGKGKGGKVTHYFVKGKDANGGDTATVLSEFIKSDDNFKPFLPSLTQQVSEKQSVKIPNQNVGDPPKDASAAVSYVSRTYGPKQKSAE